MNDHSGVFVSLNRQTVGCSPELTTSGSFTLCPLCRNAVQ